jgi:hypothetical protein
MKKIYKYTDFELIFREFILDFGGGVLPEAPAAGQTADYLFRTDNIIAELKTMTQDQTERMNQKLTPLVEQWILKNRRRPKGVIEGDKFLVEIRDMPPEIQEPWLKMLKASAEDSIKEANRQIRETKKRESLPSAKGLILIANPGNPYHNVPEDYRRLMAEVLRKRTQSGELRFDNIHGGVYFSVADVKSRKEQMYFWANLQMKRTSDDDVTALAQFQQRLQQAWYKWIEKNTQLKVRQHYRDEDGTVHQRI